MQSSTDEKINVEITNRLKNAISAFRKTENSSTVDPNAFLRYGSRRMPSTWSTPEINDQDFYTGYGFAVINKRANRSVVLGKKFLYTEANEDIVKRANENGERIIHPYLKLIRESVEFAERDFWYDISTYLDLEGIYYLMAVRTVTQGGRVGRIQKFTLLNPYWVHPVVDSKGKLGGYVENNPHLGTREIPTDMIIPIRLLNPFDPTKTYSLADAARDSQFTMKQANDFAREAIDGNLNAPGILSSAIELPDDQFDNFVARVKNHGRGEPLFGNGAGTISWVDMQADLDKAALDKINSINRDTLLAISGLSKTGVGVEESGTGREVSRTQKDDFTENAVMPQIENIIDALNLDYRKNYSEDYQRNGYTIALDNPLETDRDAEKADVAIRDAQFALLQSLLAQGYTYDIAAKFAKGLIDITDLGEAPIIAEDKTLTGDGEDVNEPDNDPDEEDPQIENSAKETLLYEGYPIPLLQYLGEDEEMINSFSEKKSLLYLTDDADKVRIQSLIERDGELIGVIDDNSYVRLASFNPGASTDVVLETLNKRYRNQLVAVKHKGVRVEVNKDFYEKLPNAVPQLLDNIIEKYQDREWFEEAWNDYRSHVLESQLSDVRMPGVSFKKYIKNVSSDKISSIVTIEEPHKHEHAAFDKQEQIDSSTAALLTSAQASENALLEYYLDQISQGYTNPHADTESFINGLTMPFAVWFTVMFPTFASNRAQQTSKDLGIDDIPVVAMTEEVKTVINDFAQKEATSHINTIKTDIENALAIIRTQTSDPQEIKAMLQAAFIDIQRRRAELVASNASARIFSLSQYEADLQVLTRAGLIGKAYKQLYSSTGNPCQFCSYIISQTNASPIPFTQAFAALGESLTVDGKTFNFDYENVIAGNVHPNCHCYYKIIIDNQEENSVQLEVEATERHTQTIIDTVKEELAPVLEQLNSDKNSSEEIMKKISEMADGLDEKIEHVESQLDQLDKRTKEARQLKEELLEANELKNKLSEAEEYARQLENLIDGQS